MQSTFVQILLFLVICDLNIESYEINEAIITNRSSNSCIPYDLFLDDDNPTIALQAQCLNCTYRDSFSPNMSCKWKIHNKIGGFIQITNDMDGYCANSNDTLLLTDCNGPNGKIFINSEDFRKSVELVIGEGELCVEFMSGPYNACTTHYWQIYFSLIERPTGMVCKYELGYLINDKGVIQ